MFHIKIDQFLIYRFFQAYEAPRMPKDNTVELHNTSVVIEGGLTEYFSGK